MTNTNEALIKIEDLHKVFATEMLESGVRLKTDEFSRFALHRYARQFL